MTRSKRLCVLALLLAANARAAEFDVRYWAWQRNAPLDETSIEELRAQNVSVLYWQAGELDQRNGEWHWGARFNLPALDAGIRIIPVVRIETRQRQPFGDGSTNALVEMLAGAANSAGELQIDYDCPDALISDYASMLKQLRARLPHVSITALPHWSHTRAASELRGAVDELLPMLYDFQSDPIVPGAEPIPLIVPEKIAEYLREWNELELPWRVGLPVFSRATVFDANGKSRGHIRQWNWDDICFNSGLALASREQLGVTKFRAERDTHVGNGALSADQLLATRIVDREALAQTLSAAKATNARGVVFFRLPDSTDPSGWSLRQLANLNEVPHFALCFDSETSELELTNESDGDLVPQIDASARGYALQIDAAAPVFRDGNEGDFWRLVAHAQADDAEGRAVPLPIATRLTFWFSGLRAHRTLRTGAIRLASGADFSQTRYRILNFAPQSTWQPVAP